MHCQLPARGQWPNSDASSFARRQLWINHKTRRQSASGGAESTATRRERVGGRGKIGWQWQRKDGWYAGRWPVCRSAASPWGSSSSAADEAAINGRTAVNTRWLAAVLLLLLLIQKRHDTVTNSKQPAVCSCSNRSSHYHIHIIIIIVIDRRPHNAVSHSLSLSFILSSATVKRCSLRLMMTCCVTLRLQWTCKYGPVGGNGWRRLRFADCKRNCMAT